MHRYIETEKTIISYAVMFCIGILAQEKSIWHAGIEGVEDVDPSLYSLSSHVAAAYVKFVEAGGARVVPVL